jgi:hypothetical protein
MSIQFERMADLALKLEKIDRHDNPEINALVNELIQLIKQLLLNSGDIINELE